VKYGKPVQCLRDRVAVPHRTGQESLGQDTEPLSGIGDAAVSVEAGKGSAGPPTTPGQVVVGNKLVNVSRVYQEDQGPADPAADVAPVAGLARKVAGRL